MESSEYIIRLILRARDEMAGALSRARSEMRGMSTDVKALDSDIDNLNKKISGLNTRLSNTVKRIEAVRGAMDDWTSSTKKVVAAHGDVDTATQRSSTSHREHSRTIIAASRDTDSFLGRMHGLANALAHAGTNVASFAHEIRGMVIVSALVFAQQLISVLASLGGTLLSVGSSAVFAGAALGGAMTSAAAQAVPAIGLLTTAFQRAGEVMDAVKQRTNALQQAATQQSQGADQQRNSIERVKDAQDALRSSQERLQDQLRRLAEAQRDLTQARRDGRRELEDVIYAEKRAELAARGAALSQREAREQLAASVAAGQTGDIDRTLLDRDASDLDRNRSLVEQRRARQDAGRAARGGVESLDGVRQARQAVDDAVRGVRDAQRGIAAARRNMREARTDALATSATVVTAARNLDYLLGQMSDAERRLYRAIVRIRNTYDTAFRPITDSIVNSFARTVERVDDLLNNSRILGSAQKLADAISGSIDSAVDSMSSKRSVNFFVRMTDEAARNMKPLTRIMDSLWHIFMNIAEAARPALRLMLGWADGWANGIERATGNKGAMEDFFVTGARHLQSWIRLFGSVIRLFMALAGPGGAAQEGKTTIDDLTAQINKATEWVERNSVKVRNFFREAREGTYQVAIVVWELGKAIARIFGEDGSKHVESLANILVEVFIPAIEMVIKMMGMIIEVIEEFLTLPIVNEVAKFGLAFILFGKIFATMIGVTGRVLGMFVQLGNIMKAATIGVSGLRAAFAALAGGQGIGAAIAAFRNYITTARTATTAGAAAAATARTGVVTTPDGRKVIAGSPADRAAQGGQAPIIAPVGRGGAAGRAGGAILRGAGAAARAVGPGLAIYGGLSALTAEGSAAERLQQGVNAATFGLLPGLKSVDERMKIIMERASKLKRVIKMGEVTDDWDDFSKEQQEVIRGFIRAHNRAVTLFDTISGKKLTFDRDDIRSGFWANNFSRSLERLQKNGIESIRDLRIALANNLDSIKRAFKEGSQGGADAMIINFGAGIRALRRAMRDGTIDTDDGMREINRLVRQQMRFVRNNMDDLSGEGRLRLSKNLELARDAIKARMQESGDITEKGMARIRRLMAAELEAYGIDPKEARHIAAQGGSRDDSFRLAGRAGGGWLGNKGERGADGSAGFIDGHPVGRGEAYVANYAHVKLIDSALQAQYGFNTDEMFKRVRAEHAGMSPGGFAKGGRLRVPRGGFPDADGALPGMDALAWILMQKFGLSVMDGRRAAGTLTTSGNISDHTWGGALDMSNGSSPTPQMDAAHAWMRRTIGSGGGWVENYAGGIIKQMLYRTGIGGNHYNHIHVALNPEFAASAQKVLAAIGGKLGSLGGGLMGEEIGQIKKQKFPDHMGALSVLGAKAVDNTRRAANKRLRELAEKMTGTPGGPGVPGEHTYKGPLDRLFPQHQLGAANAVRLAPGQVLNLARKAGFGADSKHMEEISRGESGHQPGVVSWDGGWGLLQMTPRVWGDLALKWLSEFGGIKQMLNPWKNMLMGKRLYDYNRGNGGRGFEGWYGTRFLTAASGGELPGPLGRAIPLIAHGKEWILNEIQKAKLSRLTGLPVSKLRDTLGFSGGPTTAQGGLDVATVSKKSDAPREGSRPWLNNRGINISEMLRLIKWIDVGLADASKDVRDSLKSLLKASRTVRDTTRSAKKDAKAIERLEETLKDLKKGDEDKDQDREIKRVEERLKKLRGLNESAWTKYLNGVRDLTREGGVLDRFNTQFEQFSNSLANRLLRATYRIGQRGVVTRQLDSDEVSEAELDNLRSDLPVLRRNRQRIGRVTRNVNTRLRGARRAERSAERDVNQIDRRLERLRRGDEDKEEREEIKKLERELKNSKAGSKKAQDRTAKLEAARNNLRQRAIDMDQLIAERAAAIWEAQVAAQQRQMEIINQRADDARAGVDRIERMWNAVGRSDIANSQGMFAQRIQIARQQMAELQGQVAAAAAIGNHDLVREINESIAELNISIYELAAAQFQAAIDAVNKRAGTQIGFLDAQARIAELQAQISGGDPSGALRQITEQRRAILEQQRGGLLGLLSQAQAAGNIDQIEALTQQLYENQIALLENTLQMKELEGSMSPQSFSSTAWQLFRNAIFDGSGGLLPQYAQYVPHMAEGGHVIRDGLAYIHAGEDVTPRGKSIGQTIHSTVKVDVHEAGKIPDPEYYAKRIAFEQKSAVN